MENLDIKKHISEIYSAYDEAGENNIGALIAGVPLIGKTTLIGTAPGPIAVYSFDPKGLIVLRDEIRSGRVLPFTYWQDDLKKPFAWQTFCNDIDNHITSGLFRSLSSIAIDSATYFLQALQNQVVVFDGPSGYDKKPRLNNVPFPGDYRIMYNKVVDILKRIATQPINIFLTVHLEPELNDEGRIVGYDLMLPPKLKSLMAGLFTETWVMIAEGKDEKTGKSKRRLLTDPWGMFKVAGSQLSKNGLLDLKEQPNIGRMMKKAGVEWTEKPKLR